MDMAFCSNCGAQLEGDSRFCVKCGSEIVQEAAAPMATTPAAAVAAVSAPAAFKPVLFAPPPSAQPFVPPPIPPGAPGQIPIVMGLPPQSAAKGKGWLWGLIIVCAVLYGLYYIGTHDQQNQQNPGQAPAPQVQPGAPTPQAQPGVPTPQAQPGYPQQQQPGYPQAGPGYQQQPGYPQQQPGYPGAQPGAQGGNSQALVQAQQFAGQYQGANGVITINQGQWRNGSNETIQSATLECIQYGQTGQPLTQMQSNLNGPAQPGQTISFPSFQVGAMVQGVTKVNCGIVAVAPAN